MDDATKLRIKQIEEKAVRILKARRGNESLREKIQKMKREKEEKEEKEKLEDHDKPE